MKRTQQCIFHLQIRLVSKLQWTYMTSRLISKVLWYHMLKMLPNQAKEVRAKALDLLLIKLLESQHCAAEMLPLSEGGGGYGCYWSVFSFFFSEDEEHPWTSGTPLTPSVNSSTHCIEFSHLCSSPKLNSLLLCKFVPVVPSDCRDTFFHDSVHRTITFVIWQHKLWLQCYTAMVAMVTVQW